MRHQVIIEQAENGYVVTHMNAGHNERGIYFEEETREVFGGDDALVPMLTYIGEHFGEPYDRYGTENIRISFDRKGHKAE